MHAQDITKYNAVKNDKVFTISNKIGKIDYYIDTANNRAFVEGQNFGRAWLNVDMMTIEDARNHYREHLVYQTYNF